MDIITYILQMEIIDSAICLASKSLFFLQAKYKLVIEVASGLFPSKLILIVLHFTELV